MILIYTIAFFSVAIIIFIPKWIKKKVQKQTTNVVNEPELNYIKEEIEKEQAKNPYKRITRFNLPRKKWLWRKRNLIMQGNSRNLNHKKRK